MTTARRLLVTGTVQSVGFRPFVARLASVHQLAGCVFNTNQGVEIQVEGSPGSLDAFANALVIETPPAARIESIERADMPPSGMSGFRIADSERRASTTVNVPPDLPVCDACLDELRDPTARRFEYPYISCADCGPRYSIIRALPYDRIRTTMVDWPPCTGCEREYRDPADRRFHVEAMACPSCGPRYHLIDGPTRGHAPGPGLVLAAERLREGALLALKGVGGYHLSCDAMNAVAVAELRRRKFRKCRPFAVMVRDLQAASQLIELTPARTALLESSARPVVLAPARISLPYVAPDTGELGVMLPYAPIHHLLFSAGAPDVLVMTSANHSNEPIAFEDDDALERL
ncbi:MAG TPA: Sua5/YciO/YrdC/YwlC family protein, partial [Vicinamibacterales bacterium]|nr:Sua5/YciO/YrdC/YwlC family protein [Vicinamibacterales bacterium]